jgi:hypothetical protein
MAETEFRGGPPQRAPSLNVLPLEKGERLAWKSISDSDIRFGAASGAHCPEQSEGRRSGYEKLCHAREHEKKINESEAERVLEPSRARKHSIGTTSGQGGMHSAWGSIKRL